MKRYVIKDIAAKIGIHQIIGDENVFVTEPIQLDKNNERSDVIMWANAKKYDTLKRIKQGVIICQHIDNEYINPNCQYLISENPRNAFSLLLQKFFMLEEKRAIAQSAKIDPSVKLGKNLSIGENVVIESDSRVGDDVTIGHNTVIRSRTYIGNSVNIGSNNVIGGVGFSYEKEEHGDYILIPHIGNVVIENNVDIGNCTCIDRGVLGSTLLKENCKIDNLVHIAHGALIGRNALIIAHALIAGSVQIGDNAWIAPSASIIQSIKIGKNATIGLGAVVLKDVPEDEIWVGNPAKRLLFKE
jgi:UDP-3-O-[3-hydroxymyristoyl] glucosamine N-acyltransferase